MSRQPPVDRPMRIEKEREREDIFLDLFHMDQEEEEHRIILSKVYRI